MLSTASSDRPITKAELESQFKSFAKKELAAGLKSLHNQLKKDFQEELTKVLDNGMEMRKSVEHVVELANANISSALLPGDSESGSGPKLRREARKSAFEGKRRKTVAVLKGRQGEHLERNTIQRYNSALLQDQVQEDLTTRRELSLLMPDVEKCEPSEQLSPEGTIAGAIESIVLSQSFEYGVAFLVLCNVILLGFETQVESLATTKTNTYNMTTTVLDRCFCGLFTLELLLRIAVYREQLWLSNFLLQSIGFDAAMVALQILDQVLNACSLNVHALSVLRIIRIARVLRLLHLFDELSALIAGMTNALGTMLWTVFLVALMMYMFSIIIMQVLIFTGDIHSHSNLDMWFGSVDRAVCTMFEVVLGGLNWSDVLQALTYEVSPLMGLVMSCYIVISLFFLMNLVCGVFVDRVTKLVREDKDELLAKRLGEIFTAREEDGIETEVTWESFAAKLKTDKIVQHYFASIDVRPNSANARGLFELIDVDGSGSLSGTELTAGCLRLRGPAKALEVALLSSDVASARQQASKTLAGLEQTLFKIDLLAESVRDISESVRHLGGEELLSSSSAPPSPAP